MRYSTHLATSLVVALPLISLTAKDSKTFLFDLVALSLGAILPDIDHPDSYIGRRIPILPALLNRLFGHRGITHSLIALVLVCGISYLLLPFTLFLPIGYFFHLVEDSFSRSRVAWLQPFSQRKFGIALYKTGSGAEKFWFVVMLFVLILEFHVTR